MVVISSIIAAVTAAAGAIGAAGAAIGAGVTALGAATGLGTLGVLTAGASLAATGVGIYGQYKQQQAMAAAQRNAEALRKKQMQLELNNQAVNKIREAQMARSQNLVKGTNQLGSGAPFGSAIANSNSSVESALGYQLDTTGQAGSIGYGIFAANASYSDAKTSAGIFSGISSLGQTTLGNLAPIERVGNYITGGAFQPWDTATSVYSA